MYIYMYMYIFIYKSVYYSDIYLTDEPSNFSGWVRLGSIERSEQTPQHIHR